MVSVQPNHALVRLAVISRAGTTEHARASNAERATQVIARVREALGQDADIQTKDYLLTHSETDGYVARNMIEIQVHDPALAGKVIDVATRAGANVISGINSSATDDQNARAEVVREAAEKARSNAEALAAALGLRIVRVISAESSEPPAPTSVLSTVAVSAKRRASAITPLEASAVEFRARVTVTLEVAP